MMAKMMSRAEQIARAAQRRKVGEVAQHLRALLGSASIEVEEARVLVLGRRWRLVPRALLRAPPLDAAPQRTRPTSGLDAWGGGGARGIQGFVGDWEINRSRVRAAVADRSGGASV